MEIRLCNKFGNELRKDDEVHTRFKLRNKGDELWVTALIKDVGGIPLKESKLFTYFVIIGDHLNSDEINYYSDVIKLFRRDDDESNN